MHDPEEAYTDAEWAKRREAWERAKGRHYPALCPVAVRLPYCKSVLVAYQFFGDDGRWLARQSVNIIAPRNGIYLYAGYFEGVRELAEKMGHTVVVIEAEAAS